MMVPLFRRAHRQSLSRRRRASGRGSPLGVQRLEPRLALAFVAQAVQLTTQPLTFGWNIVLDDAVDAQGYGRDLYMRRGDDGNPYALIADNPQFRDSQRLSLLTTAGPATTFYVTTGGQQSQVPAAWISQDPSSTLLHPNDGDFVLVLPKANPLTLSGRVTVNVTAPTGVTPALRTLSFDYAGVGLQANTTNRLNVTVTDAAAWNDCRLSSAPTATLSTVNGVSIITFQIRTISGSRPPDGVPPFGAQGTDPTIDSVSVVNAPYTYFNPFPTQPFSFTVVAGQSFDQRLIVDLAGTGSRISLQSPWLAALGDADGDTPGVNIDPGFYLAYSGLVARGQVCLYASEVSVSQLLGSTSVIDVGNARARSDRVTVTGDLVRGSAIFSNLPASKIQDVGINDFVSGAAFPEGTQVIDIDTLSSTVTLSAASSVNATNTSLTFVTPRLSGYTGLPYALDVTSEMRGPAFNALMSGNDDRDAQIVIAQSARFTRDAAGTAADAVTIKGSDTDVFVEGWINAVSQNYVLQSSDAERQFAFSTRSRSTGAAVGTIGGGTLAANLGNLGGTTFDIRTQLDNLRIDSGKDQQGLPYRNAISVSEVEVVSVAADAAAPGRTNISDGKLTVDAVAASSGPITLATEDSLTFLGSAIRTSGDLVIDAGGGDEAATKGGGILILPATVTSSNGSVTVRGPAVKAGTVTAGGRRAIDVTAGQTSQIASKAATPAAGTTITLASTARLSTGMAVLGPGIATGTTVTAINGQVVTLSTAATAASASGTIFTFVSTLGDALIDAGLRAGGPVLQPVRAATNMSLPALSGSLTVDGVRLRVGDRVLVKDQAKAFENGIYVVAAGPWSRAVDARLSSQFIPGFVVYAEEGATQEGGWCFGNEINPIVGETGLTFVPVTATRTYSPVRLATTANISLFGTNVLVDGRTVALGDRILVKDQTNKAENGVYVVTAGRWERADQADEVAELTAGSYVAAERSGTTLTAIRTAGSTSIELVGATTANVSVGMLVEGVGVPAGTLVTAVTAVDVVPRVVTLSQACTTSTTDGVTFTAPIAIVSSYTTTLDATLVAGDPVIVVDDPNLTVAAVTVGMSVTGTGIAPDTYVKAVNALTNEIELSIPATAAGTSSLSFVAAIDGDVVAGLDSTAGLRRGMLVVGTDIPDGVAEIVEVLSDSSIRISKTAATPAPLTSQLTFFELGGQTNAGRGFALTNDAAQVGVTQLDFVPFVVQAIRTNTWSPQQVEQSVRVATTADIKLTGLQTVDGVAVQAGDRVLVKNQLLPLENGIWLASAGAWTRAGDTLPREAAIYILEGASGQGTTWVMNDSVRLMGQLTSGSQVVTGLTSTNGLTRGMLAVGPGIKVGTTIEFVINSTTIRLSRPPVASNPNAILTFMGTGVVDPFGTPLAFVPAGGNGSITAVGNIQSSTPLTTSRVQGATAYLTAGRRPDGQVLPSGFIDTRVTAGRVTATAPESITLDAAGTLDAVDVRTTTSGSISILAENTLVARSVIAASASGTPSPISIASTLGDVVVTAVTTPLGDVSLRADGDGRVIMLNGGTTSPGVASLAGSVGVVTDGGTIDVAGKVVGGGTGSDVSFRSATGGLILRSTANVSAVDQLLIDTPNAELVIEAGAKIAASRLSVTAKFGDATWPSPALNGFTTIEVNRTDPGDIVYNQTTANLTIEGAGTVDGDITFVAPNIAVTGSISANGSGDVTLQSTGTIAVGAPISAIDDCVRLNSNSGITFLTPTDPTNPAPVIDSWGFIWYAPTMVPQTYFYGEAIGGNLTAAGNLMLGVADKPTLVLESSTTSGSISIIGSNVTVLNRISTKTGSDPVTITATMEDIEFGFDESHGDCASGGWIAAPPTDITGLSRGPVLLTAAAGLIQSTPGNTQTSVRGGDLTLVAKSADLTVDVVSLTATVDTLTIQSVGDLALGTIKGTVVPPRTASVSLTTLQPGGDITQVPGTGVTAGLLSVNATGSVLLTSPTNDISGPITFTSGGAASLANNYVGTVTHTVQAAGDVSLTNLGNLTVGAGGVTSAKNVGLSSLGGNVLLDGSVTALDCRVTLAANLGVIALKVGSTIVAEELVWSATTVPFSTTTPTTPISLADFDGIGQNLTSPGSLVFAVGSGQRLLDTSTLNGNITVTGTSAITIGGSTCGPSLISKISAGGSGSTVTIKTSGGNIDAQYADIKGSGVVFDTPNDLLVGTANATSSMTVKANVVRIGQQPNGRLLSGGTMAVTANSIRIRNGGLIGRNDGGPWTTPLAGNQVNFANTTGTLIGITSGVELVNAFNALNLLPMPSVGLYSIPIGASFALPAALPTVVRPVSLSAVLGSTRSLSGNAAVTNGITLSPNATGSASGSSVKNLTFSGFSGTAIQASSLSGLTISGVKVNGISLAGSKAKQGTGVKVVSVSNSSITGNTFTNCAVGIWASGFCNGTGKLTGNTYVTTTKKWDIASARGFIK